MIQLRPAAVSCLSRLPAVLDAAGVRLLLLLLLLASVVCGAAAAALIDDVRPGWREGAGERGGGGFWQRRRLQSLVAAHSFSVHLFLSCCNLSDCCRVSVWIASKHAGGAAGRPTRRKQPPRRRFVPAAHNQRTQTQPPAAQSCRQQAATDRSCCAIAGADRRAPWATGCSIPRPRRSWPPASDQPRHHQAAVANSTACNGGIAARLFSLSNSPSYCCSHSSPPPSYRSPHSPTNRLLSLLPLCMPPTVPLATSPACASHYSYAM